MLGVTDFVNRILVDGSVGLELNLYVGFGALVKVNYHPGIMKLSLYDVRRVGLAWQPTVLSLLSHAMVRGPTGPL